MLVIWTGYSSRQSSLKKTKITSRNCLPTILTPDEYTLKDCCTGLTKFLPKSVDLLNTIFNIISEDNTPNPFVNNRPNIFLKLEKKFASTRFINVNKIVKSKEIRYHFVSIKDANAEWMKTDISHYYIVRSLAKSK